MNTITEFKKRSVIDLCRDVLQERVIILKPQSIRMLDKGDRSGAAFVLQFTENKKKKKIEYESKSIVEPMYHNLVTTYRPRFPSLAMLELRSYDFRSIGLSGGPPRLQLEVRTENSSALFVSNSNSLSFGALGSALDLISFYANCELAFGSLLKVANDAKGRNRQDIYQRACYNMSKLTGVNSYEVLKGQP